MSKIQPSTATSKNFDTKQHNINIPKTKQKAENISGYSKINVEPNITKQQKTHAEDTYLQTYKVGNEISIQNKPYNQFPVHNNIDNMSTFTTISPSAIQQVTRPYEQPQDPFLVIQAQQTDQVLLKNRETQIGLERSTAQNQSELQVVSTTRDNISGKQTVPAVVRPKTKIHEPRVDSGELDINVQSLKERVCQIQTQNVQQTAMSTEKIHNYQWPATMAKTTISSQVRNSYPTVLVSISQMNTQINPGTLQNTMTSNEKGNNIYDANGELLNQPFSIVNSVATTNIAHNTEYQIAGSSQSWQNLHQQQLLGNNLVRNEIENNIEPNLFVQQYRTNTINDFNSASVNQLLGLTKSDKKYTDHLQLIHRPLVTTIYNNSNNYQNEFSQLPGPTVPMFNDNSNPNPSHFSQLPQCLPQPVPENLGKHYIAKNVVSNKQAIKLPPLSLTHFNGNPLRYHEWINNFFSMVHNNSGITDTHRITYLQNSVSGKAKQINQSYSCNPAYYETALNELMNHFGDPSVVVSAFINQLESWHTTDSNNKKSFVAFSNFLKRLVQTFEYHGIQADLQSSTLLKKAKEKVPYNILLKWTELRLTTTAEPASLRSFQLFLERHAQIYDTINREQTFTSFRQQQNNIDYVKDFSVPMAHYKPSSQINNQNLFGKDNSNAVLQPAIKPQITTSNREWSSSVTISNNTKTKGKQQNNRHCPIAIITIFWQLFWTTKSNHHKIEVKSLSKTNCARIV